MTDIEEMNESISSGLLYFAKKADKRIGLISGKIESLLGIPSVYICELAIVKEYRGQGLAAVIQSRFIASLPHDINILWGTIDAGNVPSTKAAERLGRRSIRNEYFVPVELLEG
jgi:RimJ/RimL family protein N-acetyltransferase